MKQEFISTIFKTQKHNGNANYNTNGEAAAKVVFSCFQWRNYRN